jgi:hypothetical protein
MSRWLRLMPAVIFAGLLAGCGEGALNDSITLPGGPAFDGSGYATGGNVAGPPEDDTTTTATVTTDPADDDEGRPEQEERGGYAVGGN